MNLLTPVFAARGRSVALAACLALLTFFAFSATASAVNPPQIGTNYKQTCMLFDAGNVRCVGDDTDGQLGNGPGDSSGTAYVDVTGLTDVVQLATGDRSTCARHVNGTVSCWGQDSNELMVNGPGVVDNEAPVQIPGLANVAYLAGGDYTYCALMVDTTVTCWGENSDLQAGVPVASTAAAPTQVAGLTGVQALGAGGKVSCALMAGGTVKCWGDDSEGNLGNGPGGADSAAPLDVPGLSGVVQLAVGYDAVCALMPGGTVKCWGRGDEGQQGSGGIADQDVPTDVPGLTGVQRLITGYESFCALMPGGTLKCWGYNGDNEFGIAGDTANKNSPVDVPGVSGIGFVPEVFDETLCVGFPGGTIKCWGYNSEGQAGVGPTGSPVQTATDIPGLDLVTQAHPGITPAVTVTGKPKVDRRKRNYTVKGSFTSGLSGWVAPGEACVGNALVSVKYSYKTKRRGKNVKKSKTVKTRPVFAANPAGGCIANYSLKLPVKYLNKKSVTVKASFAGNGALQPINASVKKRLPKVKVKK